MQFMILINNKCQRLFLPLFLIVVSLLSLLVWMYSPIYPDEIALRLQTGRYIQDKGVVWGIYSLCTSNIKETPLVFIPVAWMFSMLDLHVSPLLMRIVPFFAVMMAAILTIWIAFKGKAPNAAVVVVVAFIGVAGSSLIFARHEYVQVLNIACCLWVFCFLESFSQRHGFRYGLLVLLIASGLLSIFAHIQGLLFLPLTIYLAYQLIYPHLGKFLSALFLIVLFVVVTSVAFSYHPLTCTGYPKIEQIWVDRVINFHELDLRKLMDLMTDKWSKYYKPFLYKDHYTINYLPGITNKSIFLTALNLGVTIVLFVNLLSLFIVTIVLISLTANQIFLQKNFSLAWVKSELGNGQAIALMLIALPVIFLFIYDLAQNFYRSFFLNLIIAILLALVLSRVSSKIFNKWVNRYFILCFVCVCASLVVNYNWFMGSLRNGYSGPSIRLNSDWNGIDQNVKALALTCGVDLNAGGIVIDDMTYDSLKRYPHVYPITYLALQAHIINTPLHDVIALVKPNYAIARCEMLREVKIAYSHRRGDLCCVNFKKSLFAN